MDISSDLLIKIIERISWGIKKRRILSCGANTLMRYGSSINGYKNISIGDNFSCGKYCILETWESYQGAQTGFAPCLVIGNDVTMNRNCYVSCMNKVYIGDGCLFGDNCYISDNSHGNISSEELNTPPLKRPLSTKGPVIIGKNVWVGRNVCILPDVVVGDGTIIGANSVVTKSVPPKCVVAGSPAVVIKHL